MENELQGLSSVESDQLLDFVARLTPQWLAGFFDGEGCVGVYANGNNTKLDVSIAQKEPGILAIIALKFPSKVTYAKKDSTHHISWCGRNALPFLEFIKDYSIVKKAQIDLALDFATMIVVKGTDVPNEWLARRFQIGQELKRLKGK